MQQLDVRSTDCLLVIDVQSDFCTGGALAVPDAEAILSPVNELSSQFDHVVLTQDWHPAGHSSFASEHAGKDPFDSIILPYGEQTLWPDHCIQGTAGARFHPELLTATARLIVRKGFRRSIDSYSAFFENDHTTDLGLAGYLRTQNIERLVCVGLAFDYCVRFSALDARQQGFDVCVVSDACRGIDVDNSNAAARQAMLDAGVVVI